jgi:hypothetical protein
MVAIYKQYGQVPFQYVNGFKISNDATTPNSIVNISAGSALDSTGTFQVVTTTSLAVSNLISGLGGLDTGTVAASKLYALHVVFDPVTLQPTGGMLSLSATAPVLPFGYNSFSLVGYVATDSSSHFLLGYWNNNNSGTRTFFYDSPQATAVTAGAATSYTAVDLSALVPLVDGIPVWIASSFTPGAASRTFNLQPVGGTGNAITVTGQVTAVVVTSNSLVMAKIATAKPEISYKVSNAGDAVAINVAGYEFNL